MFRLYDQTRVNLKFYLYGVAKTLEFQSHTAYSTGTTVLHLNKMLYQISWLLTKSANPAAIP